jgi:hypothetical protein
MRYISKAPFFLGWLSFYAMTQGFVVLLAKSILPRVPQLSSIPPLLILFITYFLIGFLSFVISIRVIVFPLYKKSKSTVNESATIKPFRYMLKWIEYTAFYLFFCVPLMFRIGLPYEEFVRFAWQLAIGYGVYYSVGHALAKARFDYNQKDHESRETTPQFS